MYIISYTLITEDFPVLRKTDGEKRKTSEDIVSKTLLSMTQYNFRTRQGPISSLSILIRWAPFRPADMHTVHARE